MPEPSITTAASLAAQLPAVWTANQMASFRSPVIPTGFERLNAELPNGGWPKSALTELLIQQHGIGEMQLLKPSLAALSRSRRVALIQPPFAPNGLTCHNWGLRMDQLLWIKAITSADAIWAAEKIFGNGSCGAVVLWQTNVRPEALRRLHLAAQSSDTCVWLLRPMAAAQDASPAPLRLSLRPARAGIAVNIVKRRGPHSDESIYLSLVDMPSTHLPKLEPDHALLDQRVPTATAVTSTRALLV